MTKENKKLTPKLLKEYPQLKGWLGITTLDQAICNIKGGIDPDLPF